MEQLMQEMMKSTKDLQTFWENRFAQLMEEMVKSQNFITAMTRSLEGSLDLRRLIDSAMGRWAEFYQVVTKKDLALIQQQMYDQSVRLEKMVALLETIRDAVCAERPAAPTTAETATDATADSPKAARKAANRSR
ncbi:MAG: hypothetical protein OZSIB_1174 [Candidatus Ozemobacter sibiricus]|jgi:hypothetical protein|uniref:Poly(3-hydroxyalkanoate) polymerase subunit PhaE n=1 Tax=Candidatus Ozemobacter sibiricus TaxID=2268124 RepID=A0A367ZLC1_9BACT|nr:MAG: hypothetical protein OZSIB_1174 [Candidatus Ozemobacter sibiricus]